jgi:DNA-binding NarL/FixJ family response regulator
MSDKIRILNVDDHPIWCEGVAAAIGAEPDMLLIAQASSAGQAIELFDQHRPDVTLMDLSLPDMSGIDALINIRSEFPDARIIILTTFELDHEIRRALGNGAHAYILKSMPTKELADVIRQVHAGKKKISVQIAAKLAEHYTDEMLTNREVEVLRHLIDGNHNRDIAEKLFITEETVKAHMKNIMHKLGANDRTHALAIAFRRGLVRL